MKYNKTAIIFWVIFWALLGWLIFTTYGKDKIVSKIKFWSTNLSVPVKNKISSDSLKKLIPLNVKYMLEGNCYAHSDIEDDEASGGFGGSDNLYAENLSYIKYPRGKLSLVASIDEKEAIGKYLGFLLYLVNDTDTHISFKASDSRLEIIRQAFYQNSWKPIEYLPRIRCGNSYHKLILPSNHHWSFKVPIHDGNLIAKQRFVLYHNQDSIFSNEFEGFINVEQLSEKQGHTSNNIMDPYFN